MIRRIEDIEPVSEDQALLLLKVVYPSGPYNPLTKVHIGKVVFSYSYQNMFRIVDNREEGYGDLLSFNYTRGMAMGMKLNRIDGGSKEAKAKRLPLIMFAAILREILLQYGIISEECCM